MRVLNLRTHPALQLCVQELLARHVSLWDGEWVALTLVLYLNEGNGEDSMTDGRTIEAEVIIVRMVVDF